MKTKILWIRIFDSLKYFFDTTNRYIQPSTVRYSMLLQQKNVWRNVEKISLFLDVLICFSFHSFTSHYTTVSSTYISQHGMSANIHSKCLINKVCIDFTLIIRRFFKSVIQNISFSFENSQKRKVCLWCKARCILFRFFHYHHWYFNNIGKNILIYTEISLKGFQTFRYNSEVVRFEAIHPKGT